MYRPLKDYECGMVMCKKYNMSYEWMTKQQLNRLVCVEDTEAIISKAGEMNVESKEKK